MKEVVLIEILSKNFVTKIIFNPYLAYLKSILTMTTCPHSSMSANKLHNFRNCLCTNSIRSGHTSSNAITAEPIKEIFMKTKNRIKSYMCICIVCTGLRVGRENLYKV